MARTTRSFLQRERDRENAARLALEGCTHANIAVRLGVSRQQVDYDLRIMVRRWRQAATEDVASAKARELAKIDNLEGAYWAAWQRSLRPRETKRSKRIVTNVARDEASIETTERDGNPAFLAGVMACIERRCKLLGLDEPAEVDITSYVVAMAQELGLPEEEALQETGKLIKLLRAG